MYIKALLFKTPRKLQERRKGHRKDGNKTTLHVAYQSRQPPVRWHRTNSRTAGVKYKWRCQTGG